MSAILISIISGITGAITIIIYNKVTSLIRKYNTKCPKCGKQMNYLGDYVGNDGIIPKTDGSEKRKFGKGHVYQCPYCGTGKII